MKYEIQKQQIATTINSQLVSQNIGTKLISVLDLCADIQIITIDDEPTLVEATKLNRIITDKINELESDRKMMVKPKNDEVKKINETFKIVTEPLLNIQEQLRNARSQYMTMLENKRKEEQRKADALAEKERQRLLAEAQKKAEQSQRAAEKGRDEKATVLFQQSTTLQTMAENVGVVKIEPKTPKIEGVSFRDKWSCEEQDHKMAIQTMLNMGLESIIEINIGALNKLAQSSKGTLSIAGIKILYEKIPVDKS